MRESYEKLLEGNKRWVKDRIDADPEFFQRLSKGQSPTFLWIGCADSRVPANEVTGTQPGEVFVHRNVANLVVNTDLNMLSVLQYAVDVLKVKHVIVCGHYGCGGVNASLSSDQFGLIDHWLRNIKDVYRLHRDELDAITDPEQKSRRMVELNVQEQVYNLGKTPIIQNAWRDGDRPQLHGWVYDLADGFIRDLGVTLTKPSDVERCYRVVK